MSDVYGGQNAAVPIDGVDGLIRILRDDDVLLGRGRGSSKFIGKWKRQKEGPINTSHTHQSANPLTRSCFLLQLERQ